MKNMPPQLEQASSSAEKYMISKQSLIAFISPQTCKPLNLSSRILLKQALSASRLASNMAFMPFALHTDAASLMLPIETGWSPTMLAPSSTSKKDTDWQPRLSMMDNSLPMPISPLDGFSLSIKYALPLNAHQISPPALPASQNKAHEGLLAIAASLFLMSILHSNRSHGLLLAAARSIPCQKFLLHFPQADNLIRFDAVRRCWP
jgi:hypothetical protein